MNQLTETGVVKKFVSNPKFSEFGHNIPSRTTYVKTCENLTTATELKSGDKIARHMTVHWEDHTKTVGLIADPENSSFEFALPPSIGDFFSISWAINDEVLQEYGSDKIISLGFEECEVGRKTTKNFQLHGNLTLIKGKAEDRRTCSAGYYEERIQASFNMYDQHEMWKNATRGWMDFVISKSSFRKVKLTKPMIWIQSKMTL